MPPTIEDIREFRSHVADRRNCWVCSGVGQSLCDEHRQEVADRVARFNLNVNAAAFELRADNDDALLGLCQALDMAPLGE